MAPEIDPLTADFEICHNCGIVAVRPNLAGRFLELVQLDDENRELCWIFGPMPLMKTPDGPVPNEAYRVLHGGATELRALKDWFIANSITFAYAKFYVPCSNGPDGPYYGGPGVPLTKAFSHEQISLVRLHGDFTPMQMIEQAWVAISRTAAHPVIDILHEML